MMEITEKSSSDYNTNFKPRMTKDVLKDICKKNNLYIVPKHNDVLYLHFKGYSQIENLEEYVGLKSLWLENNCITSISGLDNQTELVSLFLHNNAISKIENINFLVKLDTINLSHNFINKIENLDMLPKLNSLIIANNKLSIANDIAHLVDCKTLSIVDLSHNYLDDPEIVDIFARMESLSVLYLTGNSVISKIKNYRKILTLKCKKLRYLDERPIFEKDRLCTEAWSIGGIEAEQAMRKKLKEENEATLLDSVKSLMTLRLQKGNNTIIDDFIKTNKNDNLIVSKDYYDINDSSDDSSDESVKVNQLVCEMNSNSENYSGDADALEKNAINTFENNDKILFVTCNSTDMTNKNSSTKSIKLCKENEFIIEKNNDYNQSNEKHDNINNTIKNNKLLCDNNFLTSKNQHIDEKQSVENIFKDEKTSKHQKMNENQAIENNSKDEDTSQIVCINHSYCSLEIIPDADADDESHLSVFESEQKKIEDISILLPWQQSNLNEEKTIIKIIE